MAQAAIVLPAHSLPLTQTELLQLDQFLHSDACGSEAMGLSRAHGFLTAAASGPEGLEAAEWLRLVFDEAVFADGDQAQAMLGLALRLYHDIELGLAEQGAFRPVFESVRDRTGKTRVDATVWCQGFIAGLSLFREHWSPHDSAALGDALRVIFELAEKSRMGQTRYAQLCETLPSAAETMYRYWREA